MTEKGSNDLEYKIETLTAEKGALYADVKKYREENEALQKQKLYLQSQCRKAGAAILKLEAGKTDFTKEIDRLSEENSNLQTLLKGAKQ